MRFEYDANKSKSNLDKHGVDFETAKELWLGFHLDVPARVHGETRVKSIGRIKGETFAAIWTPRAGAIRIISVRRATRRETSLYGRAEGYFNR